MTRNGDIGATVVADVTTVRKLTPLETERAQGFPDGWTDVPGNLQGQRYKQIGNAVTVPVAEWIFRRLKEADDAG